MATSSRASSLFGIQDWTQIYQSYRAADFNSYDYETLRKNFIDYITARYPETFNDFTENSEFVALLDVMAYMGQALAFRGDLNARENFIDTAERRDSVVKLATLVGYTPKRNTAGQGLVKVLAVSTTENITDIRGTNLTGTTVLWNDPANPNWQDQFNTIINATLINSQRIGRPGNSNTVLGVKTDEYTVNLPQGVMPVLPYTANVDGNSMPFELVNVSSLDSEQLYEPPPQPRGEFNMLYRNDRLGYGSINTGFFLYFKQGTLTTQDFSMPERIENNFQLINIEGINNTDTWLFGLTDQGAIRETWRQVETVYINSNLEGQSALPVFSVESRANDQVTYLFGDGVFGEVPVGLYRAVVRAGNALSYTIDPSEMSGITVGIPYISRYNKQETLLVTFSLLQPSSTATQREALAEIKQRAPTRYYTQNRMVNGEDYTVFPYTLYSSIIKSRAVNRSSIGVSRNLDLVDPTGRYSSVNCFGDDGALYRDQSPYVSTFSTLNTNTATEYITQTLPQILGLFGTVQYYQQNAVRFDGVYPSSESTDQRIYWQQLTVLGGTCTGYFYVTGLGAAVLPIQLGSYTTYNTKYITSGTVLKFVPPPGYYYDLNNRLVPGTATAQNQGRTFIWTGVQSVVGDGNNFGQGALSTGQGPVTLSTFIPQGSLLQATASIIPSFDNTLSTALQTELLRVIEQRESFTLYYDDGIVNPEARWGTTATLTATQLQMIQGTYNSADQTYTVLYNNTNYVFGSVSEVRFIFEDNNIRYDPVSGTATRDYVMILKTNSNSAGTANLNYNYIAGILGQTVASDGYPLDYSVLVTTINNQGLSWNPDFFTDIVDPTRDRVFFRTNITTSAGTAQSALLPPGAVITAFNTQAEIYNNVYQYPQGTVFYAVGQGTFWRSSVVPGSNPQVLIITDVSTEYSYSVGRSGLFFQYRHNSSETTRIDPGTTNIIDIYLVTQSYYTAYQNWLQDTTDTVPEPTRPTISELEASYSQVNSYKMMSDSVVLNSVVFKPLFGQRAQPALRGTIKVIKSPNTTASDSQIRSSVLGAMNTYFSLENWTFGATFYASELIAYLHAELAGLISSVVLVPADPNQTFGDLFEVRSLPNEIFVNGATAADITIVAALTAQVLQRG